MSAVRFTIFFLAILLSLAAEDKAFIVFEGHIGKEEVEDAAKNLPDEENREAVFVVNSLSGDIREVLSFARRVYSLKRSQGLEVSVFIDDNAVGPAAILPFLADKLYTSIFVTWGDIPSGTEAAIPTNLLRSQITSLVSEENPNAALLTTMAEAMVDDSIMLVEDNGWTPYTLDEPSDKRVITSKGENLIVSHRQLRNLDLVTKVMSLREFEALYGRRDEPEVEPAESAAVISNERDFIDRLEEHIQYSEDEENIVGRIYIGGHDTQITQGTWLFVKSALDHYKEVRPIFIILELNTPGGQVFASQKIADALREMDTELDIPVVCYINDWAISAGAMLAYSCRFITTDQIAAMGAASPVMQTAEGVQAASEKVTSALRADFANRAAFFGRNSAIAEAMVDEDIILVLRHGKFITLDTEDQIRRDGASPDIVISGKGKLLTLNARQLIEYGVADLELEPARLPLITTEERAEGRWPGEKELLFHQEFFKDIPNVVVDTYQADWRIAFLAFLANPMVASALFMGMMIGFYVEFNSPGFGIPGGVGVGCLFLILLSSFAMEAVNWLEVIIICVGIALILVDLFLIPTFGIVGVFGIILFIGGFFALMIPGLEDFDYDFDTNTLNPAAEYAVERLGWLALGLILSVIVIVLLARYVFPALAPYSRFVLYGGEESVSEGYFSGEDPKKLPPAGSEGEAMTDLRPSGKVFIDGKMYEAVSDGEYISKGAKVQVLRLNGNVIVVSEE